MFGLIRILIISIRTVLNCIFFPFLSLVVILVSKVLYDVYGMFNKHTWALPETIFNWLFGNYKAWDFHCLSSPHIITYCVYGSYLVLFLICTSNLFGVATLFIKFLRSNSGVRNAMNREDYYKDRIIKACDNLERKYKAIYNKTPKIKVKLIDSQIKNAVIFSDNVIVLTTELLENSDNDELEGVIAHEWGHMHNGDTIYNQLSFTNAVVSNNIEVGIILRSMLGLFAIVNHVPFVGTVLGLFLIIFFGPFIGICFLFAILSSFLSTFEALISQRQEYLADQFALSLDAGDGLLTFLYADMKQQENFFKIMSVGSMLNSTLKSIYRSHPASEKRIKRLEKILNKKQPELVKEEYRTSKWIN